jgi:predicted phage-related endonuclease
MKIHDLQQGSDAWHQFRLDHFGASEASAMLGLSKKVTRTQLLHAKHTGIAREFSNWVQTHILDYGHEVEALARPLVEAMIGDDLYPVTCSEGRLSASCDGLTLGYEIAFEHKQWSEALAASVQAGMVPDEHMPQCQQLMMVTGAQKVLFVVSDGTPNKWCVAEVFPDPVWFERIRAGWAQFDRDLSEYVPIDVIEKPAGKAPETLPALRIEVTGMVTASNLDAFKQTALAAIRSVNRELSTDVDFANAESAVKWCSEVESRLAAAKEHALSQTASIDLLFKTIDDISAEARSVRLELDKLVKHRKESIRGEIVAGAVGAFAKHVRELSAALGRGALPPINADFAGVIKGKRTVASLRDAVDTELARVKIEANAIYQRMSVNERALSEHGDHATLFPDWSSLLLKAPDDLAAVISSRIAEHQAKEAKRLDAERERIRAEEQAKAQREAAEAQRVEAARVAAEQAFAARAAAAVATPVLVKAEPPVTRVFTSAPAVVPIKPANMISNEPATLKLGTICERLGFAITAAFVTDTLGIAPSATDKAAKLFKPSDFPRICAALQNHVGAMYEKFAA